MPLGGGRGVSPLWMLTKIKEQFCCSIRELRSLNMVQKSAGSISSPHLFPSHWLYSFLFPQASCWIALAVLQERAQNDHFCGQGNADADRERRAAAYFLSRVRDKTWSQERPKESKDRGGCFGPRGGGGEHQQCQENHQQAYLSFYVGT